MIVIGITALASLVLQRTHILYGNTATAISTLGMVVLVAAALQAIAHSRRRRRPSHEYNEGRGTGPSMALALVLGAAVLIGSISVHAHAVSSSFVYGKGQPFVGDQVTPAALDFFRARGRPLPVVLAPFTATPVNWYSGISYDLVGGAPVYAAAISSYHTQSERLDHPQERRRDAAAFLDPATSAAERGQILDRWHVTDVAVDLKTAPPALVRQLDADPSLTRVYTDPPRSDENFAQLAVWSP